MSNTLIMWAGFVLPWFTLILLQKKEVKRLMPVAMFSIVTSVIIYDIGLRLGLWAVRETFYPFEYIPPYILGLFPVLTLWIFRFTYGRFWAYMMVNTIFDIGFNFFFLSYFLPIRGIWDFNTTPLSTLPITLIHAVILYGYQMWQEGVLIATEQTANYYTNLHSSSCQAIA